MCANVCGGVAQTYKRLHQTLSVGYSLMALQTVFMAGLTLVYCVWISPDKIFTSAVSNDINACSIVLFVITERWPAAKKYRDAFETLKQIAIDPLSEKRNLEPRRAIRALPAVDLPLDEGRAEYSNIVTHMSGLEATSEQLSAIGTEQVQYQMGQTLNFQQGPSPDHANLYAQLTADRAGFSSSGSAAAAMNDEQSLTNDLEMWSADAYNGDIDYGTAPFDLTGCSADMGWMFDSFPSLRGSMPSANQMSD